LTNSNFNLWLGCGEPFVTHDGGANFDQIQQVPWMVSLGHLKNSGANHLMFNCCS
jgi:hypothetical protein